MCRFLLNLPNAGLNTQVLHYTELDPKEREDPMAVVFPKVIPNNGSFDYVLKTSIDNSKWTRP